MKRSGESRVVKALWTGGFAASKAIPAGLAAAKARIPDRESYGIRGGREVPVARNRSIRERDSRMCPGIVLIPPRSLMIRRAARWWIVVSAVFPAKCWLEKVLVFHRFQKYYH